MFTKLSRREEGFTLIELLVVVAIIALLAAFAVPRLFDAITKARKAPGQADIQTISSAIERYNFEDTSQLYPDDLNDLTGGYLKNGTTFKNGFGKGFVYVTNSSFTAYMIVDPADADDAATSSYHIDCGSNVIKTGITLNNAGALTHINDGNIPASPTNCEFRDSSDQKVLDSAVVTY